MTCGDAVKNYELRNPEENTNKFATHFRAIHVQSKKDSKNQESIQSSTTPVPGRQMRKQLITINITNKGRAVSPFPSGDHEAAMNRCECMANTRHK